MTILQLLKEVNEDLQSSKNYGMVLIPIATQKLQKAIALIEQGHRMNDDIEQLVFNWYNCPNDHDTMARYGMVFCVKCNNEL